MDSGRSSLSFSVHRRQKNNIEENITPPDIALKLANSRAIVCIYTSPAHRHNYTIFFPLADFTFDIFLSQSTQTRVYCVVISVVLDVYVRAHTDKNKMTNKNKRRNEDVQAIRVGALSIRTSVDRRHMSDHDMTRETPFIVHKDA